MNKKFNEQGNTVKQHSILLSIGLHLLPGVLITGFYILVAPLLIKQQIPPLVALLLAAVFVLIPFEMGYLLYEGRKRNGKFSLKGIVVYQQPIPGWYYPTFGPVLIVWSLLWFRLLAPVDSFLIKTLFFWLPNWFFNPSLDQYSDATLMMTFVLLILVSGVAVPVVEELYFRGYLLPRVSRLKGWAPVVNIVLFSLYHFFTPWQNLTRIIALIPIVYVVHWKKNIYLGMVQQVALNTLGALLLLSLFFG